MSSNLPSGPFDPLAGISPSVLGPNPNLQELPVNPLPTSGPSVSPTVSSLASPTSPVVVENYSVNIEFTPTKGTIIKIEDVNDPRLDDWSKNGYKVYVNVVKDGVHFSGNTMRCENAVAFWKSVLNRTKSPVPVPLPTDKAMMGQA